MKSQLETLQAQARALSAEASARAAKSYQTGGWVHAQRIAAALRECQGCLAEAQARMDLLERQEVKP